VILKWLAHHRLDGVGVVTQLQGSHFRFHDDLEQLEECLLRRSFEVANFVVFGSLEA
jgi:hypothetical protein